MLHKRTVFVTAVVIALAAAVVGVLAGWGSPAWWGLPGLALGVGLSEKYPTKVVMTRGGAMTFSLTDVFIAAGLLLAPGAWLAVALVAGYSTALIMRRVAPLKIVFNLANFGWATVVGALVTEWLGADLLAALCGVLAFYLSSHLLTAVAVSLSGGDSYGRVLRDTAVLPLVIAGGNVSVGLLGGWLAVHGPIGLIGLIIPIGLLWWSYAQQAQRVAEARLFEELAQGHEQLLGASVDASAQVIVTAAARMFGGAEVELLFRHPDGLVRYIGGTHGVTERRRAEPHAFGEAWVLRALAAGGVKTGLNGEWPYCSAVLGDQDQPLAVLEARRPNRSLPFTRADEQLVRVLAGQAESWLSIADLTAQADQVRGAVEVYRATNRVLGELGAETTPALVVLRESSDRLARLASRFDGPDPVSQIVDELHSVERAVASLLGAIALAQPAPDMAARAGSEWTTTGRLEPVDDR
jgi:hypothetical protein